VNLVKLIPFKYLRPNAVAPAAVFNGFTVAADGWVQISPYGDFPHPKGLQRVDKASAQIMINDFNSTSSRLGNLFRGLPFYIGHPDAPPPICDSWPDKSAYGWIKKLDARDDGFYGQVKWNAGGIDIIENAKFMYLSPAWYPKPIGKNGSGTVMQPVILKSVGFVNDPNIPVMPLANAAEHIEPSQSLRRQKVEAAVNALERQGFNYTEAFIQVQKKQSHLFVNRKP
jgi:phage I-like protein